MPNISPFIWFDDNAEEAVAFYLSVFPNSEITQTTHYGEAGPGAPGSVMTISFRLDSQDFTAMNGGKANAEFNDAISFMVHGATQKEVDQYWDALTVGGEEVVCGWLRDRFGLRWQIVPDGFMEIMGDNDPERAARAMRAMQQMVKLDIEVLRAAVNTGS